MAKPSHDRSFEMLGRSSEPAGSTTPDPLSEVLQDLRLTGVSYGRCELTRPWGIRFPPQQEARFHFVADGRCWLQTPAQAWVPLVAGDVALLPHGTGHALSDKADGQTKSLETFPLEEIGDNIYRLNAGGGGERTVLACCSVRFAEPAIDPLLELMPQVMLLRDYASSDAALAVFLDAMSAEVAAQRVGAATVMARLADVVIAKVIRAWVEAESDVAAGGGMARRDPRSKHRPGARRHPSPPGRFMDYRDAGRHRAHVAVGVL